jgi:squalene-hopene/tetraprenyl-beta-curcumene cyclase
MVARDRLAHAYCQVRDELLAERNAQGHWTGELSSSALSTATAVSALVVVQRYQGSGFRVPPGQNLTELIQRGVAWLVGQQNEDGGFGDTDLSHSNIATTYLVVASLHLTGVAHDHSGLVERANAYIYRNGRLAGLRERYGIDKTFVVPIMTNLALAGLVDWGEVAPLPFELACVPQSLYRFVGMPVVSYAIPALVAIGQVRYFHAPPWNPVTRLIRRLSIRRSLQVLRRMQPHSGGYLEATPLTSFVVMSLASVAARSRTLNVESQVANEVIAEGVRFLVNSIRADGSWPIDTNLATWNTTLAINALAGAGENVPKLLGLLPRDAAELNAAAQRSPRREDDYEMVDFMPAASRYQPSDVFEWILCCQHAEPQPLTGADVGGFGWSDLSGAVPDADDTAGALLALTWLYDRSDASRSAIGHSLSFASGWLSQLQNADGGWPTFCRGWGKLPFDRSGTDLTAHAIRAIQYRCRSPYPRVAEPWQRRIQRGLKFLGAQQHLDGSWSPLWFGNQDDSAEENPVYGTAKVLMAYRDLELMDCPEARRGVEWLVANENEDGGWGNGVWQMRNAECGVRNGGSHATAKLQSSVEETALAVEALLASLPPNSDSRTPNPAAVAVERGLNWLIERVERGEHRQPAPIGFYFAKLWYYEKLYPLTFTVAALGRAHRIYSRLTENGTENQSQALRSQ